MSNYGEPYAQCEKENSYDCEYHNGANGCYRRKDNFCIGGEVCAIEWDGYGKCETCGRRAEKSYINCVYGGLR